MCRDGGVLITNQDLKYAVSRNDITVYELPVKDIMAQAEFPKDFADRIANMIYVGACCFLFDIPLDIAYAALLDQFNGKEKPAQDEPQRHRTGVSLVGRTT